MTIILYSLREAYAKCTTEKERENLLSPHQDWRVQKVCTMRSYYPNYSNLTIVTSYRQRVAVVGLCVCACGLCVESVCVCALHT